MKTNIKTTIGIIAIALSGISAAQAGDHRRDRDNDRNYEKPRHERSIHHREHRKQAHNRHDRLQERRHFRKHKKAKRIARRHLREHRRAIRHNRWKHAYRSGYNRGYYNNGYYNRGWSHEHSRYAAPRHSSHNIVVNADPLLPIIAGGIVASKIAKKIVKHDPILRTIVRHDPIARAILGR